MRNQYDLNVRRHWAELEAQGVPLEPPEFRSQRGKRNCVDEIVIEQQGDIITNSISESELHYIYYILDARIVIGIPGITHILESFLLLPWVDRRFDWLPDPADQVHTSEIYKYPGGHGLEYHRSLVLNHQIKRPLSRGAMRQGLLLGIGWEPIPQEIRHGAEIEVTLVLVDQWGREHPGKCGMWVCRSERPRRPIRRTREPLFAHRDLVPKRGPTVAETSAENESSVSVLKLE